MQGLNLRFVQRPRHCDAVGGLLPRIHEGRGYTVDSTQAFDPTVHPQLQMSQSTGINHHRCCASDLSKARLTHFGWSVVVSRAHRQRYLSSDSCACVPGYPLNVPRATVCVLGWVLPNQRQAGGASTGWPPTYGYGPSRFSGHSFRIGEATTVAQVGIQDVTLKMLGRLESSTFQCYVRTPREQLAGISVQLAQK